MAGFLSNYRKDYTWPIRKPYFPRNDLTCTVVAPITTEIPNAKTCKCEDRTANEDQSAKTTAKLGACPKAERLEFSKTDTCLKKLYEDNPNLFRVIKKSPSTDAIKKFNMERLKTTYQADYNWMGKADIDSSTFIPSPSKVCPLDEAPAAQIDCRPQIRSRAQLMRLRLGDASVPPKNPCAERAKAKRKQKLFDEANQPTFMLKVLPAWSSEYRDVIGKTGAEIMREMRMSSRRRFLLHRRKLLEMSECDDKP